MTTPNDTDPTGTSGVCWITTDQTHTISGYSLHEAFSTRAAVLLERTPTAVTVEWNPGHVSAFVVTYVRVQPSDCTECGDTNVTRYADGTCFTCHFWAEQFATPGGLIINGNHYRIGDEPTPAELAAHPKFYGCYGDEFVIRMSDGTQTVTHNLWSQGEIPARLSRPDNAAFVDRPGGTQ